MSWKVHLACLLFSLLKFPPTSLSQQLVSTGESIYGYPTEASEIVLFKDSNKDQQCPISFDYDFPDKVVNAAGGLIQHSVPTICGGKVVTKEYEGVTDKCYSFGNSTPVAVMKKKRTGASGIVIDKGTTLWITGGSNKQDGIMDSTEHVKLSQITTTEGPALPVKLESHCSVNVHDNAAIIVGGTTPNDLKTRSTWIYQFNLKDWAKGPDMKRKRSNQSCGLLKEQTLVAVGGLDAANNGFVEIWSLETTEWKISQQIPIMDNFAASVAFQDGSQMMLIGGCNQEDKEQANQIHELQCQDGDCNIANTDKTLTVGRCSGALAFEVPNMSLKCIEYEGSSSLNLAVNNKKHFAVVFVYRPYQNGYCWWTR